ncbi:phospholipid-translocating ATPase [Schistosoma bovis]|uniref:Phospholipid-translocating ATPase n=1 Tax=Schistosoma bovis TaxID=6184 RepID=A0A430Q6F5_SCHBO|nr:phospholipid-translocating ATPase [Schistosoma bovis]
MYRRLFQRKHDLSPRIIYPSTLIQYDKHNTTTTTIHYKSALNYIKTTKYTLLTFIPYNLWEQLHRFANIYFIFILILNFIPEIDAFAKEIAPIPVLITLIIVAIKDAYEDFRRYLLDRKVNKKPCEVYSVQEKQYIIDQWQYLRPGDFVRLHTNDIIPADILLLATSNSTGICHIETSNLDGESNLKQREIISNLLNKAALNNSGVRFKRSKLEKQINLDVIWCVLILVVVCVTGAIGSAVWHQNLPGDDVLFVALDRNSSTSTPAYQVERHLTIIPLPLYVTIEFVKMHQVWHMNNDLQLYDSNLDRRIEIRTFNIPEDLGQIEYVFTDKTGTLTENKMEFKRASINGKDYYTNDGDYHENNGQFSKHSSPKHIVTNLNTLQSILENRTIFSHHQKTINNDMEYSDYSSRNYYFNTDKEINNIEFITKQQSNEIPSTSHIQMDHTNTSSYYLSHSISSSSSFQQNNIDIEINHENQWKINEKSNNLFNEKCNSIENKSKPLYNQILLTEEIRIQDFFLALAICNTTVVSVTKNTPTMFQEPPPRRKGFRDFFRSGKFNSVTYLHQKLRKTKQQQQQQQSQPSTLLDKSNIIIKDKIDNNNNNDNHHLSRVKQTINLSNLFSNKLRSTKIDKTNTQSDKLNDHHHHHDHHDHNSPISSNLLVTNNINHNTIINHTNLINHEETSQETFIMDDSISTKLDDIEIQSIKIDENYHRNEINQIDNNNNNNNQLLKINNININSARLFNELMKDNYYKESILYYYSSRCLPPVIEALNLDIIFKNSNHILNNNNNNNNNIQMNIENKKFIGHYFESLESANHRFDLNKDNKLDNQHDNNENLTNLKDLKLNLVKEKSVQNDKNQLEEELEINTARTLTVRIPNGSSFELPIESDIYAQTPSELKQCPLSDNTLFNSYESESPDEICLVKEACKHNYKLLQRGVDFILLWLPKLKFLMLLYCTTIWKQFKKTSKISGTMRNL